MKSQAKNWKKTCSVTSEEEKKYEKYWGGDEIGCSFLDCGLRLHTERLLAKDEACLTKKRKNIFVWKSASLIKEKGLEASTQFGEDFSKQSEQKPQKWTEFSVSEKGQPEFLESSKKEEV